MAVKEQQLLQQQQQPAAAPIRVAIPSLENHCVARMAKCIHTNTYTFKSLRGLPWGLLQRVVDSVLAHWSPKWSKAQALRVLLLFCEPNLTTLNLDRTLAHDYLLDTMLDKASTFPALYSAHLLHDQELSTPAVADDAPLGVPVFPSLRSLGLFISTQTTSQRALVAFLGACRNLRVLRLAVLDDAVLQRLFVDVDLPALLPRLESLEVNYQGNSKTYVKRRTSTAQNNLVLPNTFILDLINQPLSQLHCLSLRDRLLLTPTTIKTLTLRAPSLVHLVLDNTEVTDSNIAAVARHCRQLRTLSLRECRRLSDAAFEELGRGFLASLQHLSVAGCRKLTDTSLNYLLEGSPRLRVVDARGCTANLLHENSLLDLLTGLRHLEALVLSFNDSKSLDDVPPESGCKIQVSRRYFSQEQQQTASEYFFFHAPTATSPLPHLPAICHQIWPPSFWTTVV